MEYNRSIYRRSNGFPSRQATNYNRADIGAHLEPPRLPTLTSTTALNKHSEQALKPILRSHGRTKSHFIPHQ